MFTGAFAVAPFLLVSAIAKDKGIPLWGSQDIGSRNRLNVSEAQQQKCKLSYSKVLVAEGWGKHLSTLEEALDGSVGKVCDRCMI